MRTTIEFDADTAKVVEDLRRTQGRGVSEAVNELIRRAALSPPPTRRYQPRSRRLGVRIDVSNVAEALDLLEGDDRQS